MTEVQLFLLASLVTGFYVSRLLLRLAPIQSELVLKTIIPMVLAALVALSGFVNYQATMLLEIVVIVLVILYIFGPMLLIALARSRFYKVVNPILNILYQTESAKKALKSFFAQIALSQGNLDLAVSFIDENEENPLLLAQTHVLKSEWQNILDLDSLAAPHDQEQVINVFKVRALIELGRLDEAKRLLAIIKSKKSQNPLVYKSVQLSEARLLAEEGRFAETRQVLEGLHSAIAPYQIFEVLARAAEQQDNLESAISLYQQAYKLSPQILREKYAAKLKLFGQSPPEVAKTATNTATLALMAAIALAYVIQFFLEKKYGIAIPRMAAGFLLNISPVPQEDAVWRYLSYAFLHGGLVHLGFNLWVLLDIGSMYEKRRNWAYMLASFVLGTIMGAVLTVLAEGAIVSLTGSAIKQVLLVGASGGILGIAGALLVDARFAKDAQDKRLVSSLIRWMIMITVFSLVIPNVSLWGHLGGFIGGMIWGGASLGLSEDKNTINIVGIISVALMLYSLFMSARVLWGII
ncbi:MAG TPA: rhomboid family intramembrane serine protease [Trueperaceae bacterium]|nr:rhomboid family intramembrane serine protease [Trueperaceae bacterium]